MKTIVIKKKKVEIQINLLMATMRPVVKVNIIDHCSMCYFCKVKKRVSYCNAWGNLRKIKNPKGKIIEQNCILFDYKSYHGKTKKYLCGTVTSKI